MIVAATAQKSSLENDWCCGNKTGNKQKRKLVTIIIIISYSSLSNNLKTPTKLYIVPAFVHIAHNIAQSANCTVSGVHLRALSARMVRRNIGLRLIVVGPHAQLNTVMQSQNNE